MGGDEWDGGLESVGCVRMVARMGAGRDSCAQEMAFVYLPAYFFEVLESLDGSWELLGLDWGEIGHHSSKLMYCGSPLVLRGQTLRELGSSLITLGRTLVSI